MSKLFLSLGAVGGLLAVLLGAFGSHGLRGKIADNLFSAYQTGVEYQMYHALALLLVGILLQFNPGNVGLKWSGYLFAAGILLFSGSAGGTVFRGFGKHQKMTTYLVYVHTIGCVL